MTESRITRLAPLSGVVSMALLVGGELVMGNFEFLQSPAALPAYYIEKNAQIFTGAGLSLLSALFLVWFAGSLRSYLRSAEGEDGRLSAVAFGGGVLAAAMVGVAYSAITAAAERATATSGITPDVATVLHDFASVTMGGAYGLGLAAMLAATSIVAFRTGAFGKAVIWIGAIVALALASQMTAPLGPGVAVAWMTVFSVILYLKQPA